MSDERFIDIEQQRAYMQRLLRDANMALMVSIDQEGQLMTSYMNMNNIERRGLIDLLQDTKPAPMWTVDDDD